jgi:hypothetical protein
VLFTALLTTGCSRAAGRLSNRRCGYCFPLFCQDTRSLSTTMPRYIDEVLSDILTSALKMSDKMFSHTEYVSPFADYSVSTSAYLVVCKDWLPSNRYTIAVQHPGSEIEIPSECPPGCTFQTKVFRPICSKTQDRRRVWPGDAQDTEIDPQSHSPLPYSGDPRLRQRARSMHRATSY